MTQPLQIKILILDDDKEYTDFAWKPITNNYFPPQSYNIIFMSDSEEALKKLNEEQFDLIISDTKMPKLDGYEFFNLVKDRYEKRFIGTSSRDDDEIRRNWLGLGVHYFLVKPEMFNDAQSNKCADFIKSVLEEIVIV